MCVWTGGQVPPPTGAQLARIRCQGCVCSGDSSCAAMRMFSMHTMKDILANFKSSATEHPHTPRDATDVSSKYQHVHHHDSILWRALATWCHVHLAVRKSFSTHPVNSSKYAQALCNHPTANCPRRLSLCRNRRRCLFLCFNVWRCHFRRCARGLIVLLHHSTVSVVAVMKQVYLCSNILLRLKSW